MKKLWVIFLAGVMALAVAGCGGSGKSDGLGDEFYSSDYYGLEIGFQLTYDCSTTEDGATTTQSYITNVMSVTSPSSDIYVYKVTNACPEDGETLGENGTYVEKSGASYYSYGSWKGTEDVLEEPPKLIVTNPVTNSFHSERWPTNHGQVSVTVPAVIFTAWLFEYNYTSGDGYQRTEKMWFVPYLGFVKMILTESDESDKWEETYELRSCAKGITVTSDATKSAEASSTVKTQLIRKHRWFFY